MRMTKIVLLAALTGFIAACGTTQKVDDKDVYAKDGQRGSKNRTNYKFRWENPSDELYNRVVYFEFDKADVRSDDKELITKHAAFLSANSSQKVRLEGHSDERGSREYNIGLGERRAQSVRRLMLFQGVADRQIEAVSYGEERPAVEGHDEDSWAKNRRVELVYLQ